MKKAVFCTLGLSLAFGVQPQLSFSPPPLLTPNSVLSSGVENQFDHTSRQYFSVSGALNDAFTPLHFTSLLYGSSSHSALLGRFRASNIYGVLFGYFTKANDYEDGDGQKQGFGYTRSGGGAVFGYLPNAYNEIRTTILYDNIANDKQPHHAIDATRTTRAVFKADYRLGEEDGSKTFYFNASYRDISRRADNFGLRGGAYPKNKMQVEREIFTAQTSLGLNLTSNFHNHFGVSLQHDSHDANRFMANPPIVKEWTLNAYRMPEVKVREIGFFEKFEFDAGGGNKFNFETSYQLNHATLGKQDTLVSPNGNVTPNNIFAAHYGKRVEESVEREAFSAAATYEFVPTKMQRYAFSLASLARIGTNEERFSAINPAGNTTQAHANAVIGNPFVKNERHNQVKFEFDTKTEFFGEYMKPKFDENGVRFSGFLLADFAEDLIIYERFKNASNPLLKNHIITKNTDARIFAANAAIEANLWRGFGVKGTLLWSYGEDFSANKPLYQVRPFEATFGVDYAGFASFGRFSVGAALRAVSEQHRRSQSLGIDAKKGGFAVTDIYAAVSFRDNIALKIGIDNLLDKTYSEYLSLSHTDVFKPVRAVNAPGRVFYLSLTGSF